MKIPVLARNKRQNLPARAGIIFKVSMLVLAVILLVTSVKLALDLTELAEERERLEKEIAKLKEEMAELEYYYSSPIDEYYVRKYAWELYRLVPKDDFNYITDPTK